MEEPDRKGGKKPGRSGSGTGAPPVLPDPAEGGWATHGEFEFDIEEPPPPLPPKKP
jgi:hypothetical protein